MKLDKAIEIGELNIKEVGKKMPPDTLQALKILVEAGKRIIECRLQDPTGTMLQLPNETEGD